MHLELVRQRIICEGQFSKTASFSLHQPGRGDFGALMESRKEIEVMQLDSNINVSMLAGKAIVFVGLDR